MINNEQLTSLADFVKEQCQKDANDLTDALSFVNLALDGVYDSAYTIASKFISDRNPSKASPLLEKMEHIIEVKKSVDECILLLEDEEALEEELKAENMDEELECRQLPNYAAYSIDTNVPHTLYENFTYTKACGFSLLGNYYDAKDMRDVLVKLCEKLARIDAKKLAGFCDDNSMQGRKVKYFGKEQIIENKQTKNEAILNLGIYVRVDASCNQLRNLIMKILKKYDIAFSDFKIFLRADYKALHDKVISVSVVEQLVDEADEKIGKYIANTMRELAMSNYVFTANDLTALQSEHWSKQTFGISISFLKKYDVSKPAAEQIKINQHTRYWKDRYSFNGEDYFVASQWYERHRAKFDAWVKLLDKEV